MSDILKHIRNPAGATNDPESNLSGLEPWSEEAAMRRAADLGIELSDDHWDVVLFVRDYYRGRGPQANAREILGALEDEFGGDGGRRWLYRLFPGGPVLQAAHIAGIPEPSGASDPSFGVAH
jgi:tRNA 2-thiouridine synthesizing protein E